MVLCSFESSCYVFQYASVLDETPAYLGGRENPWRLLTLEGLSW